MIVAFFRGFFDRESRLFQGSMGLWKTPDPERLDRFFYIVYTQKAV